MFKQNYRSQVRNALLWCILETVIGGRWEQRKAGHSMMRSVDNRFAPASRLHWRLVDLCFWETDCSASSFHICGLLLVALHNSNVQDQRVSPFSKSLPSHKAVFCQAVSEGTIGAETSFRWWGSTWILSWTLLLENVSVLFVSSTLKYTWEKPVGSSTRHLQNLGCLWNKWEPTVLRGQQWLLMQKEGSLWSECRLCRQLAFDGFAQ